MREDVKSKHTSCSYLSGAVETLINVTVTVNALWTKQPSFSKKLMSTNYHTLLSPLLR